MKDYVATGWLKFDQALGGGLKRGEGTIFAGRPAMGKTSVALSLVNGLAIKDKLRVCYFSLELTKEEVAKRLIAISSNLPINAIKSGKLESHELKRLARAADQLTQKSIFIDDRANLSTQDLMSSCAGVAKKDGSIDVIVVDYLQLMKINEKWEDLGLAQFIPTIERLKGVAKEFNCAVVLLSQLHRSCEYSRLGHRPMLKDLKRIYNNIEMSQTVGIALYRAEYYYPGSKPNQLELIPVWGVKKTNFSLEMKIDKGMGLVTEA